VRECKLRRGKNWHVYRHKTRATCKGKKVKLTIQQAIRAQQQWVDNAISQPLYSHPPKRHPVPTVQEAGWALRLVWMGSENFAPRGFKT